MATYPFDVICVSDRAYLASDAEGRPKKPSPHDRLKGSLTVGRTYQVLGERLGMYSIIDDTGERYLYPKDRFRAV